MSIDTALTPMVVQLEKKSCITADDDPLRCEICLVMRPADIQVWWIKRTVRGRRIHRINHGLNQSTMAIDTDLTPKAVQLEKKSFITADDDPLRCEIDVS
jgi:hypothetical protein